LTYARASATGATQTRDDGEAERLSARARTCERASPHRGGRGAAPPREDRPPTPGAGEASRGGAADRARTPRPRGPRRDADGGVGELGGRLRPASHEVLGTPGGGAGGRGTRSCGERDASMERGEADHDDWARAVQEGHARAADVGSYPATPPPALPPP